MGRASLFLDACPYACLQRSRHNESSCRRYLENAKAAKAAGVKSYVFISSSGTRSYVSSFVPYSKMKIGVEDAIKELGFENAIILRPGMILGREKPKIASLEKIFANLNKIGQGVQDMLGT
jgi:hypothetical protein